MSAAIEAIDRHELRRELEAVERIIHRQYPKESNVGKVALLFFGAVYATINRMPNVASAPVGKAESGSGVGERGEG